MDASLQNDLQYGQDFVVEEGDELVQYIMVELPSSIQDDSLQPGTELQLQGIEEDSPTLILPDGMKLQGTYEETLGTTLLFRNSAANQQEADGQQAAQGQLQKDKLLLGLSESRLVFKPVAAPQPTGGAGVAGASAEAVQPS